MTPAGRPPDSSAEPFLPDLSEGAETGVYLALLELIDEGLIITGDEVIFDANSAACRLLERDYRDLAGRPLSQLFPGEEAFLRAREQLLIRGERRSVQRMALPDGSSCELQVVCAPRLRPGIHALVLSPAPSPAPPPPVIELASTPAALTPTAAPAIADSAPTPGTPFATHLDPAQLRVRRYGNRMRAPLPPISAPTAPLSFDAGLRAALAHDGLIVHFQPLVDARTAHVHAGEALLRWRHPQLGVLPFRRFKAAIVETQLLADIGDWVLRGACAAARSWPAAANTPAANTPAANTPAANTSAAVQLTVNVAFGQLAHGNFAERVAAALEYGGLPPSRLELDLGEDVLAADRSWMQPRLQALAELGVRLAIDDFGRGLSSVAQLRRYPLRALKLDPALVSGVGHCEESEAIVEAITSMANALGLQVVARGVEDAAQQAFLCALGCDLQQGPLFGPPLSAAEFSAYLAAAKARTQ